MPAVVPFYSSSEESKPPESRIYHNSTACPAIRAIPKDQRNIGTNGYEQCPICRQLIDAVLAKISNSHYPSEA
jgi:hypothetical protein